MSYLASFRAIIFQKKYMVRQYLECLERGGVRVKKLRSYDFKILTYKCLNFLTFLTHTEIWENFSLKPPKIWQFMSEKSEIIPKHF